MGTLTREEEGLPALPVGFYCTPVKEVWRRLVAGIGPPAQGPGDGLTSFPGTVRRILLFFSPRFHIEVRIYRIYLSVSDISFSRTSSRFIHVVANHRISFFLMAE